METQHPVGPTDLPANHHAHHPGFSGIGGLVAAVSFTLGRDGDADLAARLTGLDPGDHVVDVGCGPGVAVRRAARSAASVVGVDPASVMLRVGRLLTRGPSAAKVRYLDGTAESLPVADGSATVVWSLATVHHWHDIDRGLAEVRRVLAPGGGRFLAIERKVHAGATGHASHGWTAAQAEAFAQQCRAGGFVEVEIGDHRTNRGHVLSVLARTAPTSEG